MASAATESVQRVGGRKTPRRNRDAEVLREAIHVISERGYAATSIQEVADRVGILKGSMFHYFSSKEELLLRILEQSHEQTVAIANEVSELDLPPFEELLEYLRRSSLWYVRNVKQANIFFTEVRNLTEERLQKAQGWGRDFEKHIQNLVDGAQQEGRIRSDQDPRLIARFVIGAVNHVRNWPSRSGTAFSEDQIADTLVAVMARALSLGTPRVRGDEEKLSETAGRSFRRVRS